MSRPVTNEDRKAVRRLHAKGKSLRAIAREIGRSPVTVGRIAKDAGLSFDRRPTEAATRAKQQDHRARRADLVERLYHRAENIMTRLETDPFRAVATTSDGPVPVELPFVPTADEWNLARSLASHLRTAADLEKVDAASGGGSDHAASAIGQIGAALQAAALTMATEGDGD